MGIKIFTIFIIFFSFSSIFLFYQKSKTLSLFVDTKRVPLMELRNSYISNITYNGVDIFLKSKIAKKYTDRYELYNLAAKKVEPERIDSVKADKAVFKNNILTLTDNVFYKSSDSRTVASKMITYNVKEDILSSNTHFVSTYGDDKMTGSSFVYYHKLKKFIADNIKANIKLEK